MIRHTVVPTREVGLVTYNLIRNDAEAAAVMAVQATGIAGARSHASSICPYSKTAITARSWLGHFMRAVSEIDVSGTCNGSRVHHHTISRAA